MPLLLCLFLLGASPSSPLPVVPPVRVTLSAFGATGEIEVRDLPREAGQQAIRKAAAEVAEVERLTDSVHPDGGLTALNTAAGRGPQAVDPRLLTVLTRAQDFCVWSERGHGPLARDLYALWGLRAPAAAAPAPERVNPFLELTACERLSLDMVKGTASLAPGSSLDLQGFSEGLAVDRAVELLKQQGVTNALVRIGTVWRGLGEGPAGRGWPVVLPPVAGLDEPPYRVFLRDKALAVAGRTDRPLIVDGEPLPPYLNQRTGQPVKNIVAAQAATTLAVDAQALAATMLIAGPRDGQLRLGSLKPKPAVLWFLGTGVGPPLRIEYHWSEVPKK
ncbi:MAG TPA: FAD:protein FMN transferase [Thermoanaerobaculia bacterium]|nr:FAD:protein FMN transferase [Thermoanaerobaculia bacterium]